MEFKKLPQAGRLDPGVFMNRWAVFGSSGFVGSNLVRVLEESGDFVTQIASPRLLADPAWGVEDFLAAVREELPHHADLVSILRNHDVVVNAAGLATPNASESFELFGANALLPGLLATLSCEASVGRFIHLSSVAVQGRQSVLDDSANYAPFSPYSHSKVQGERILSTLRERMPLAAPSISVVRATSVQGEERLTTIALARFARSCLASVPGEGLAQSPVSSVLGLSTFIESLGSETSQRFQIVVQPWEGLSVRDVMVRFGDKQPLSIPVPLCRALIAFGYAVARFLPRLVGYVRRVEVLWFGQVIAPSTSRTGDHE